MPAMTQAQSLPPLTKDLLDAFAAHAVAWAVRLLGVLVDPSAARRRRRLTAFVRTLERFVEYTLFLRAVHAFGPTPKRRRRPASTPPGFRRVGKRLTLFWKIAHIRAPRTASLVDRVARLLSALANPAPHIAHFTKELCRGLRLTRLVPSTPPAHALREDAPHAIAFTDTS
jgi:hypothetical protein